MEVASATVDRHALPSRWPYQARTRYHLDLVNHVLLVDQVARRLHETQQLRNIRCEMRHTNINSEVLAFVPGRMRTTSSASPIPDQLESCSSGESGRKIEINLAGRSILA